MEYKDVPTPFKLAFKKMLTGLIEKQKDYNASPDAKEFAIDAARTKLMNWAGKILNIEQKKHSELLGATELIGTFLKDPANINPGLRGFIDLSLEKISENTFASSRTIIDYLKVFHKDLEKRLLPNNHSFNYEIE